MDKTTPRPWSIEKVNGNPYVFLTSETADIGRIDRSEDAELIVEAVNSLDTLKAQIATLREGLEKYGQHKAPCLMPRSWAEKCTCGLTSLLEKP
jgi:hypothetical protein